MITFSWSFINSTTVWSWYVAAHCAS